LDARRLLIGIGGGALIAIALFVGVGVIADGDTDATPEATTSTAVTALATPPVTTSPPLVSAGEVVFETTALLVTAVSADDGEVRVEYELVSLAPLSGIGQDDEEPQLVALPEQWELTTTDGELVVGNVDADDTMVRFAVPADATRQIVDTVRVVGWRIGVPAGEQVTLPMVSGATVSFAGGTTYLVDTVIEQSTSTIVQVDVDDPDSRWDEVFAAPTDPGWRVTGRQFGGLQFIWEGPGVPSEIALIQESPSWVAVTSELTAWRGGSS